MRTALRLVDIQNDYFPGGAMELVAADRASTQAALLLARCRELAWPIVHIQHVSVRPEATFFRPNTSGVDIHTTAPASAVQIAYMAALDGTFATVLSTADVIATLLPSTVESPLRRSPDVPAGQSPRPAAADRADDRLEPR